MRGDCFGKHHHMQRFMEVCLLTLLCGPECESCHGYALAERLAEFGFDADEVNASTLYRTLRGMEEAGWVTSRWESGGPGPQRRAYGVTQAGRDALAEWAEVLRVRRECIGKLLQAYEKLGQAPEEGRDKS
ncbi:MAG: helix-turn-helix transcriptional regulator [Bacillota bacterium]